MSVFTSLGIVLLSMLIQGFLQTSPGVFAVFYHHALAKTTFKKADDRSLSFVLGVEIATAIIFLTIYFIITFFATGDALEHPIFIGIMSGILILEALFMGFFYFRTGKKFKKSTALFLSRNLAKNFLFKAEHTKHRTDAIMLGISTTIIELLFTLPLFILSSISILNLSPRFGFVFIIAYIIIATLPLFTIRTLFRTHRNLAEIQRFRVKNKLFFRLVLAASYLILAIIVFISGASS